MSLAYVEADYWGKRTVFTNNISVPYVVSGYWEPAYVNAEDVFIYEKRDLTSLTPLLNIIRPRND